MNRTPDDPVVAEIRAVRRELAERFGNDVEALCDFLAQQEKQHEDRLVNRAPKPPQYARHQITENPAAEAAAAPPDLTS